MNSNWSLSTNWKETNILLSVTNSPYFVLILIGITAQFTCNPFSDDTPMNRKTPNRTGIGINAKMGVIKVDKPIQMPIKMLVTLCSLMPKNWGFSPGAELSDSFFNDCKWLMDKTVAEKLHYEKR